MSPPRVARRIAAVSLLAACAMPAAAPAQSSTKPVAITGGVTDRAPTSVVLHGQVNPKGADSRYQFEFGLTNDYTGTTPLTGIGSGKSRKPVAAGVTGLAPATRYHYRLIAENRHGTVRGEDRVFRTPPEPLGLVLGATANPVAFNGPTVINGQLTGTNSAGRDVVLQRNQFPYTEGFITQGNPLVTDATGSFAFNVLNVPVNSQFRVLMPSKPEVVSPIVTVGVKVKVATKVSDRRVRRGTRVRFSGVLTPASGATVEVQKLENGQWVTKGSVGAKPRDAATSAFGLRPKVYRSGSFRVYARVTDGARVDNVGKTVTIKVKKKKRKR